MVFDERCYMGYQIGECRVINVNLNGVGTNIALVDLDRTRYLSTLAKDELVGDRIYGNFINVNGSYLGLWPHKKLFVDISQEDLSSFSKKCREIASDADKCRELFGALTVELLHELTSSYRMIENFMLSVRNINNWKFVYYWGN